MLWPISYLSKKTYLFRPLLILLSLLFFAITSRLDAAFTSPTAVNSDSRASPYSNSWVTIGLGHGVYVAAWTGVGANPVDSSGEDLSNSDGKNEDIFFARSTDYGQTWSPKAVLKTNAATDRADDLEPDIATDGKGNWMVVWRSHDPLTTNLGYDSDILMSFSSDNGQTWSAPAPVNNDAAADGTKSDVFPHVATDGLGHWMVSWTIQDPRTGTWEEGIEVATSSNNGGTWSNPVKLYSRTSSSLTNAMYSSMATDGQGHWIVVFSEKSSATGGDFDIFYAASADNGATWSAAKALNTNCNTDQGDDIVPRIDTDGLGNWLCTWTTNDPLGGAVKAGSNILYARSTDNGQSWSAPLPVNPNAATAGGGDTYSRVLSDHKGEWIVAWMTRLWGGDLDIAYVTSKDNGYHWSPMMPVSAGALTDTVDDGGGCMAMGMTTDRNGHWSVVWNGLDPLGMADSGKDVMFASLNDVPLPKLLALTAPSAGQTLQSGTLITVKWTCDVKTVGTGVKFELWDDKGRLAELGYGWDAAGQGSKDLFLPLVPEGRQYRLRVISTWNPTIFDETNPPLTIQGGYLRVNWPAEGAAWRMGDRVWVWWESNPQISGTGVRIELWRAGAKVADLAAGWDPNGESVTQFTLPPVPSGTDYKVRIVSTFNPAWTAESAGFITITGDSLAFKNAIAPEAWSLYQ